LVNELHHDFGQGSVPAGITEVKSLSVGGEHNCVIKNNDEVQCWGNNKFLNLTLFFSNSKY